MAHTEGNWYVSQDYKNQVIVASRKSYYEQRMVCVLRDYVNNGDQKREEAEANAKLIAAAPDLLEALKEIIRITDRDHVIWDKAKLAIKKATEV